MTEEGAAFVTGVEVGRDLPAERLLRQHEAIVLCGGATHARDLPVEGRSLTGIHAAMEFLTANAKSLLDSGLTDGREISARGKDVVVIGGGDTGTDCVGTAMRPGARSLTQLETLPPPAHLRPPAKPSPAPPKTYRPAYGHEGAQGCCARGP